MATLIALVSQQRMQNIIPVFQKGAYFEQTWLVRSSDADDISSRFWQAQEDTKQALSSNTRVCLAEPSVGAYEIEHTRQIVSKIIADAQGDVVVNFTGGTKCMSVGAYLAAQSAGVTAIYVDTANEKTVWFYPDGRVEEEGFELGGRLTVRIYLQANNRRVDDERTERNRLPQKYFKTAQELLSLWPACRDTLHALEVAISKNHTVPDEQVSQPTIDVLLRHGLVERTPDGWRSSRTGRNFLGGKWLDAMTYNLLAESGLFDDVQAELRLSGVENELDVMITKNGQLAVIECKSGDLGGQTMLNKLQAIRSGLGTFARAFFVTSRNRAQLDKDFADRARQYGFGSIITAETLLQVASLVKVQMRGVPL
jgi:hypothetical protein